jgi:hypothetical protein
MRKSTMIRSTHLFLTTIFALTSIACGSKATYSAPVGVNLNARSGDVRSGTLSKDEAITAKPGNPYGTFVNDAWQKLGNRSPSRIEVNSITVALGGQSTGVTALEQVFTGEVDVLFVMNDTGNSFNVGHVVNPTGTGPLALSVDFDPSKVVALDYGNLLGGSFNVVVRGSAAAGFSTRNATANLQTSLTFKADE